MQIQARLRSWATKIRDSIVAFYADNDNDYADNDNEKLTVYIRDLQAGLIQHEMLRINQQKRIAKLEAENAQLKAKIQEWEAFNAPLIEAWKDNDDE